MRKPRAPQNRTSLYVFVCNVYADLPIFAAAATHSLPPIFFLSAGFFLNEHAALSSHRRRITIMQENKIPPPPATAPRGKEICAGINRRYVGKSSTLARLFGINTHPPHAGNAVYISPK